MSDFNFISNIPEPLQQHIKIASNALLENIQHIRNLPVEEVSKKLREQVEEYARLNDTFHFLGSFSAYDITTSVSKASGKVEARVYLTLKEPEDPNFNKVILDVSDEGFIVYYNNKRWIM